MDKQAIFDKAVARLRNGRGRCVGNHGCVYRQGDNNCVIGALLSKELLDEIVAEGVNNNTGVVKLITNCEDTGYKVAAELGVELDSNCNLSAEDERFLVGLQSVHDELENWAIINVCITESTILNERGEQVLLGLARTFGLTYTERAPDVQA